MPGTTYRFLNGRRMDTREHAHSYLKKRLRLSPYYGNNLDALADCLGEIGVPTRIFLCNAASLRESLGDYGERMLRVFDDAARKNVSLDFVQRERLS